MSANPLEHVADSSVIEIFPTAGWIIKLPHFGDFQVTKFMVLELLAAGIILAIYLPLARRVTAGGLPTGGFWNAFEGLLTFIRDQVAKPYIGHPDHHTGENPEADRYVPFLWTVFLFILVCNLLGMFPWLGSPTADIRVTGALALCSFVLIFFVPMFIHGPIKFFKSFFPHADMHGPMYWFLGFWVLLMVAAIEIFGTILKSIVLAIRLFANMFAGHTVLAVILLFIELAKDSGPAIFGSVTFVSVLGVVALSLLELFVAFLQAFVFTFLTALFFGATLHPEH